MKAKLFFTSLTYIPLVVFSAAGLFIIGFYIYFKLYKKQEPVKKLTLTRLALALVGFRIIYSIILSVLQYFTWKNDTAGIGQYLIPPHKSIDYFALYSWTHFFAGAILSLVAAYVFYFVLKTIKKHREEIFEEGEVELGLVCALIVGWPDTILLVALSFLMLLVISFIRQMFFKEQFTAITLPLLVSLPIIFVFGQKLVQIFHLESLIM